VAKTRIASIVVLWLVLAAAAPADLLRGLDTDDPKALGDAITAIEDEPATPELADVLFAAGRACEDRLYDPARALAIYERIVRELPDAGVSIAASRRIELLRGAREHAREAADLAELSAKIDALPPAEVERRASHLAAVDWPGAHDATLLLAEWMCRNGRYHDAQARFATLPRELAARTATACANEARDFPLAHTLVAGVDGQERTELLASIALYEQRAWLYEISWALFALGVLGMLASTLEAIVRGGVRAPAWRPPVEVLFLAPVGVVVVLASYAVDVLIAPAVIAISVAGIAGAWLSGATLDLLRTRGRPVRARAVVHVLLCAALVISSGYIVMTREGLLDMLGETIKFGPG
jgi:hypothetical protein